MKSFTLWSKIFLLVTEINDQVISDKNMKYLGVIG